MKANRLRWFLLSLLAIGVFQSPAQQSEADRKLLADIRAKAEKGDAQSQLELGSTFYFGTLGMAKNEVEAVKWLRKAAEQNHSLAQSNLAICYENGLGVAKDAVEAAKWYHKAAEQNLPQKNEADGKLLADIRAKAEKGDAQSQYELARAFGGGSLGVAKDEAEGVKWCRKAAEQNHAGAQCILGVWYYYGQGVVKDYVEAVK